jgi:NCS1 family nucleobase:cation symporter-1
MSDTNERTVSSQDETLQPIPVEKRILGLSSYTFMWLGGCISIGTFTLGSSTMQSGLNLMQTVVAMTLGSLILIALLCLNLGVA